MGLWRISGAQWFLGLQELLLSLEHRQAHLGGGLGVVDFRHSLAGLVTSPTQAGEAVSLSVGRTELVLGWEVIPVYSHTVRTHVVVLYSAYSWLV